MPRIFDNIDQSFLPTLRDSIEISHKSDFCVGYFNLRGWKSIDDLINNFTGGVDAQCRLLIGMKSLENIELRESLKISLSEDGIDQKTAIQLKKNIVYIFKSLFKHILFTFFAIVVVDGERIELSLKLSMYYLLTYLTTKCPSIKNVYCI